MAFEKEFRQLNEAWITKYFELEESDKQILNHPQQYILDKGGHVFIALEDNKVVGCCALMVQDFFTCELAKMVVDSQFQGMGIAHELGVALIAKEKERGFRRIVLEGNTKMEASIALYRKLGFRETTNCHQDKVHSRCNIFMEMILNQDFETEYYL